MTLRSCKSGVDRHSRTGEKRRIFAAMWRAIEFGVYEECPSHIAQKVIAAHSEQAEETAAGH
jgi:hypothetical protein